MEIKGLQYDSETTWNNVFQAWKDREGTREEWQQVAKEKGWESWEEWRDAWVRNFDAQDRRWFHYSIFDPISTVPQFRVGPTQSWQENFPAEERNQHTFATLIENVSYEQNDKVRGIIANFPKSTEFIGIYMPDKSIVNIEGHHRSTALAIMAKQGLSIKFKKLPTIALTVFKPGEEKLLDDILERGSIKNLTS